MPFFNNLRKTEIKTEGLKRYLLYAIGEILLVMIGILLALEINNWNEARKERALEKELLTAILTGLRSDSSDMTHNLGEHKEILNSQKIVMDWLNGADPYSDTLKKHFANCHAFTAFTSMDGPYEILKTSGPQLIQNQEVRNKISKLYDNTYDIYNDRERYYNTLVMESFTKINGSLFDGTTPYKLGKTFLTGEMVPNDPEELRSNKPFRHQMKTLMTINEILINLSIEPSGKKVNQVMGLIENELEKE